MGNTKLIFLLVISIAITFYGISLILDEGTVQGIDRTELENMSEEELIDLEKDWTYKDLMRNIDDYDGEIIYVEGMVVNSEPDMKSITLGVNCEIWLCNNLMFIHTEQNYLLHDEIRAYVEVLGLVQTQSKEFLGVEMGNETLPSTRAIQIFCTNC